VDFEQVQMAVNGCGQADGEVGGVDGADAAAGQAAGLIGDLVMNVAGPEHGLVLRRPDALAQPVANAAMGVAEFSLAVDLLLVFTGAHSKCLLASLMLG